MLVHLFLVHLYLVHLCYLVIIRGLWSTLERGLPPHTSFTSQASSLLLTSALLMGAAYAPRHGSGIALLTAGAYAACALSTAGYSAAYFEVCPRCAGQAFAVSNTFATLPGIAAPLIAQV